MSSTRTRRSAAALLALAAASLAWTETPLAAQSGETPAPAGYRIVHRSFPAEGVEHLRLEHDGTPQAVNVARVIAGANVRLVPVLSGDRVAGPAPALERTTSMCRRVDCIVGVNADFGNPRTGEPVGGLVIDGQLVRSPVGHHPHLMLGEGSWRGGPMVWSATATPEIGAPLGIDGVNVARHRDKVMLYTGSWAGSTGTDPSGVEVVLRVTDAGGPAPLGRALRTELAELREGGDTPIPPWGVVLSGVGAGADALRNLWAGAGGLGASVVLRLDVEGATSQSIGGTPVLLRDGQPQPLYGAPPGFVTGRHPRTMVGRDAAGTLLLVTVDGRQAGWSAGMTLAEAQELMVALGATDALNLDGGGSTTFVSRGVMINRASDQLVVRRGRYVMTGESGAGDLVVANLERPVPEALVLVAG